MNNEGLRVLVLADSRAFHTERYVCELRHQGCHVLTASFERGTMHHYHLKHRGFVRQLDYKLGRPEIRTLVKRYRPDVINPHFVSGYGFAAALAGVRKYAPLFIHLWGSDILLVPHKSWLHRFKVAYALRSADFVCADSTYLLEAARGIKNFSCGTAVIPWGLEEKYLDLHKKDFVPKTPLRVLVPRSHEEVYDNLFIVHALAPLIVADKIRLTFPDFGTRRKQFSEEALDIVGDRLHYYSRLPRPDFMKLMAEHDVYLSNAISDSSPASLIEAMGLGLVPVVADIPGVREWLGPENGFRYRRGAKEELAQVIDGMHVSHETLRQMRRKNLELVRERGLFEKNMAKTIGIMRSLAWQRGR